MTKQELIELLRSVLKNTSKTQVDWSTVGEDTTIASLGFDSLTILDLIYDVQQQVGVEFEAEEMVGVKTVGQLADFLMQKMA